MRPSLPVNLLIADDHRLITEGLQKILSEEKSIGVIHIANNGKEAIEIVASNDVDFVIMDINMPVINGLEATKIIKTQKPFIKIIVLSMLCDASIVSKLLKAGADAFINKDTGRSELMLAIEKTSNNETYISPAIASDYIAHLNVRNNNNAEKAGKQLTPREIEIISNISEGLTNTQIATKLFLSPATVDTHRKNILAKLHLHNTAALIKYAAEHKLI